MLEVSCSEEAKAGLYCLLSYVEALSPCLSRLCGVGGREGEALAGRQGGAGGGGGNVPSSADEEEMAREHGLSPAALGQDDKMDTDAGEAGVVRGEEASLVTSLTSGVGVVRGGVPCRRIYSMGQRRRESSVQGVLGDRDLLEHVFGFVGGATGRQSVRALGQVSLVWLPQAVASNVALEAPGEGRATKKGQRVAEDAQKQQPSSRKMVASCLGPPLDKAEAQAVLGPSMEVCVATHIK
jgi:hypothetical protein